jgi:hypothetical protein
MLHSEKFPYLRSRQNLRHILQEVEVRKQRVLAKIAPRKELYRKLLDLKEIFAEFFHESVMKKTRLESDLAMTTGEVEAVLAVTSNIQATVDEMAEAFNIQADIVKHEDQLIEQMWKQCESQLHQANLVLETVA